MANVFSNQKDVILFDFHHHGGIVTTEYYCGTLAWLEQTIRRERLGLSRRVAASSFCTITNGPTLSTGILSGYGVMAGTYQPLYSPDTAPNDIPK